VGRTTEAKPWEFVDAFSERDAAKCLRLRARMESSSPYALLAMCITRVRELAMVRGLMARGQQSQMTKLIKGPAWKVEKFYPRYARNFTADELRAALESAIRWLSPGGRIVVISYHSLEDRIVKNAMAQAAKGCTCPPEFPVCVCGKKPTVRLISRKPILSGEAELADNPRARSAKLRVAEKL
jgi:16S rRNA (cytosine1402-N4)-methyltransferase